MYAISPPAELKSQNNSFGNMGAVYRSDIFAHLGGQLQHAARYPRRTRKSANNYQRRTHYCLLSGVLDRFLVFTSRTQTSRPHSRLRRARLAAQRINNRHGPVRLARLVDHHAHQHRLLFRWSLCHRRIVAQRTRRKSFSRSTACDLQSRHHWRLRCRTIISFQL